jgi:hypothetical protein
MANYVFFPKSHLDHVAKPYKFLQNDKNSPSKKKINARKSLKDGPKNLGENQKSSNGMLSDVNKNQESQQGGPSALGRN